MPILALAARHHEVGLDTLERLAVRPLAVQRALVERCPPVRGAVVLATCNRVEVYLDATQGAAVAEEVVRIVAAEAGLPRRVVTDALTPVEDPAEHLCTVASGLDSMVLGEREITGQVRRAVRQAVAAGTSSAPLDRLFAAASRAARAVARETRLGGLGRSLVDVALDACGPLAGARCVLVGTGSYAGAAVSALARRGVARIEVFSATGRAGRFARERGLAVAHDLAAAVAAADLVVTCSGGGVVVGPEHVAARQGDRPLAVVDLALRRDVDPRVGELPHVHLLDLRGLTGRAPGLGADDLARARRLVATAAAELARTERALAWSADVAGARRRVLDAHPGAQRRTARALVHPASARAHAAARAGDRPAFEAALAALDALV